MTLELLPDALDVLYSQGIGACLQIYPELQRHRVLLLQLRSSEDALSQAEDCVECAANTLHHLEQRLVDRLSLQGYTLPRDLPRDLPTHPWTCIAWLLRRMLSPLNTKTPPPYRFTISDCSSKSDA